MNSSDYGRQTTRGQFQYLSQIRQRFKIKAGINLVSFFSHYNLGHGDIAKRTDTMSVPDSC